MRSFLRPARQIIAPVWAGATLLALLATLGAAQPLATDIRGHWAESSIADLLRRGIIKTGPDRAFRPNDAISRGLFVAWLVAARDVPLLRMERPPFADVPPGHEHAQAIETAVLYGVLPAGGVFRPTVPITRADAVMILMRALGHTFEAAYMSSVPLPFEDVATLPAVVRGALAVAALSTPPLLREPPSERLRPLEAMTRAEAASLLWAYLQGIETGMAFRLTTTLGTGASLVLEKRGALRLLPIWRVQAGAFLEEERARRLAVSLRLRGQPVFIEQQDELYKVRAGNFATRDEAAAFQQRLASEGLTTLLVVTLRDYDVLAGPFWSGAIVLEPASGIRLRPSLARDGQIGRERTSEAARRSGAAAAINGGFFNVVTGDPLGCLVIDGEVVSEPIPGRTCAGITDDGALLFDTLRLDAAASTETTAISIHGVNRERSTDEIILYRRPYGPTTRTNAFGAEVVVEGDIVQSVVDGRGGTPIPQNGYVLSAHGRSRQALRAALRPGDRVALRARLVPASGDPRWESVRHVFGGGPRLLADGQYVGGEGFRPAFTSRRHPRTAIGRLTDGRIVLVVVDGRQPYHSLGLTLPELAAMMKLLGVTDAMNLDGGGSSTLVVRGVVINLPSDEFGERRVSDVVLVLPSPNEPP